mgnify:CR=1 FL=1
MQFENNTITAISLLQRADGEMRNLSDSRLSDVRQALASDISMLQAVQQVDTVGIYARLNALNEQVTKLPLPAKPEINIAQQNKNNDALPWWKRGLQQTAASLQKIVVVRYNPNGALPLLTPEQQGFLYLNLQAVLEKSMWGLLHKQPDIYRSSLQQASDWTKKYFVQDSPITQAVINEIDSLQQVDVHPVIPKTLVSIAAFANYFNPAQPAKLAP